MDVRLTWTDFDEAGDYVVLNVLSPMDLGGQLNKHIASIGILLIVLKYVYIVCLSIEINMFKLRYLVSRPDNIDETVLHTYQFELNPCPTLNFYWTSWCCRNNLIKGGQCQARAI